MNSHGSKLIATEGLSLLEASSNLQRGCTVVDATTDQGIESNLDSFFMEPESESDNSDIGRGEAISVGDAFTLMTPSGSRQDPH